jgi:hypothetical protein
MHKGVAVEVVAGAVSLFMAVTANVSGAQVFIWDAVVAGSAGFFGAYAFAHGLESERKKHVLVLVGGGLASLFGPLVAEAGAYYLSWVPARDYIVDAASGGLVGLVSTPVLRLMRNPLPMITALMTLLPVLSWGRKKDG